MRFILSLVIAGLLAAGVGVGYARFLRPPAMEQAKAKGPDGAEATQEAHATASGHGEEKAGAHDGKAGAHGDKSPTRGGLIELPPIVGNLSAPQGVWVRLEGSIVIDPMEAKDVEKLRGEVTSDFLAYLSTLTLPQIQGSLGLQHLREDLDERLSVRSARRARSLVIHTLVVQ